MPGAVVVFESMFGCTQSVAEAVGAGLASCGVATDVVEVGRADELSALVKAASLLVVGAPTHMRGMSTPRTRALARGRGDLVSGDVGVHEWLDALPGLDDRAAAVFDTRLRSRFAGSAGVRIERVLRKHGARLVAPVQAFTIDHAEGGDEALDPAQVDLAFAWGCSLAGR